MNPGTNSLSLFNRNKPELLKIIVVTNCMVKMTEQCRLLKNLPKPKFYASNKRNMFGQKMTCDNTAMKWLYAFRESETAREERQTLPPERALAKEMARIYFRAFRRPKGFRIRNTCQWSWRYGILQKIKHTQYRIEKKGLHNYNLSNHQQNLYNYV